MKLARRIVVLGAWGLASASVAGSPLRMDVRPTFNGPYNRSGVISVTLENDGPAARGSLRVESQSLTTSYPIDLPTGSQKTVVTLNGQSDLPVDFVLDTDQGRLRSQSMFYAPVPEKGIAVVLIAEGTGGTDTLLPGKANQVDYVDPGDAPARPAAYASYQAVVLGSRAERLPDEAIRALRQYALSGGTLVFLGGRNSGALNDSRWSGVLPATDWRERPLKALETEGIASLKGIGQGITIQEPLKLLPGGFRRFGAPFQTERGYGLGRIVAFGFSPLDFRREPKKASTSPIALALSGTEGGQFVDSYRNASAGPYMVAGSPQSYEKPAENPFKAKLPTTSTVFSLLGLYFVLVVPVSFVVLRRLRRGELAWVTAPLLAFGFAGALFKSAESLYKVALSTSSTGVLVMQEGSPDAMFFGTSQMFFPHGGTYDLKLKGIDSMTPAEEMNGFGSQALANFNPIDVGQVEVPRLEANNLAFREMSYSQRVEGADWFRFGRVAEGKYRIQNRSPYTFRGSLAESTNLGPPFEIGPGSSQVVETKGGGVIIDPKTELAVQDARNFTRGTSRIALTGDLMGFRPGPQIGQDVSPRGNVKLLAFAREEAR